MASTSSSSKILPASSSRSRNYDVFISFRGYDTRKTFVDHLCAALEQQGIYYYKDDESLGRGESIGPALSKAIKESQIIVVVFSENYADSSWCLDELTFIMKCHEEKGKIVIPIFYHVEPSEVRKLKKKYGEAFAKHEMENKTKVESWRKALVDASNIAGWEPSQIANEHEAKCIKEIVSTISFKLHPVSATANENLIGIEARRQDFISKLEIGRGDVLMFGIWGVGGGGKTTLASSVYDEIFGSFDGCCFVENIREESASKNGLKDLQKKILSKILKQNQVDVERVEEGRRMIKSRLCYKKVLIVLDDVDHLDQLEALAGSHDWFGEGSRIIITTRDEHLLNYHKVDVIHNISLLSDDEAINLFKKHACRAYQSTDGYDLLAKDVVSYAVGLPLALKVLGSYLCDKNMNEWKSALAQLKEIPHNDIMGKLKISFDGLQPYQRQLFLDIACFFVGRKINKPKEILDSCVFYFDIGIKVLIEKALVAITWDKKIDMHDLVQEMGHYIVKREHPKDPEKHSRIWDMGDFQKICAMNKTTELDKIEVIRYDGRFIETWKDPWVISKMKKLRWIEWKYLSGSLLPKNFPGEDLCCLILFYGEQRKLWGAYKYLPNLRMIKLYRMRNLVETPNFDGLPNLERFVLEDCDSIAEIHSSMEHLERLVCLYIRDCDKLSRLPPQSQKLEFSILKGCPNVLKVQHTMDNLEKKPNKAVRLLRSYITCCRNLQSDPKDDLLDVQCYYSPHNITNNHRQIQSFHRSLTKLTLSHCNFEDRDIESVVWELSNLQELDLSWNNLTRLNLGLWQLPRLKMLDVSSNRALVELSGLSSSIAILRADFCFSLKSAGDISNCKWLWDVSLDHASLDVTKILDSIIQGNAIEDHFISVYISGDDIPKGLIAGMEWVNPYRMKLPHNWYNDFSGFLICCHSYGIPLITITIKKDQDTDWHSEVSDHDTDGHSEASDEDTDGHSEVTPHKSNKKPKFCDIPDTDGHSEFSDQDTDSTDTYVGYVSFNSLMRQTSRLNKDYNTISVSVTREYDYEHKFGVKLVPKKSKGDHLPQTKPISDNFSDYHIGEHFYEKTFKIRHHSNSSLEILWDAEHTVFRERSKLYVIDYISVRKIVKSSGPFILD